MRQMLLRIADLIQTFHLSISFIGMVEQINKFI